MKMQKTIVVGAGINGVVAAIELRKRGHEVALVDPGPLPHPLAASTDISKAVRAAYGGDEDYTALAEQSREIWRQWNVEFGVELYHEIGFLFMRQRPMQPGDFEYESFTLLEQRGHRVERIDSKHLRERYPAWNSERYPDGFLDLEAGYAESGRAVATLIQWAKSLGVELRENAKFRDLDEAGDRDKRDCFGRWGKNCGGCGCDGRWRVDAVRIAIHAQFSPRERTAGISSQTQTTRTFHPGTFSDFRRGYFDHWLLRFPAQSRRRGENRESRARTRNVAGFSRARRNERGGKPNAPFFVRLVSRAGGFPNCIHAHLFLLRYS